MIHSKDRTARHLARNTTVVPHPAQNNHRPIVANISPFTVGAKTTTTNATTMRITSDEIVAAVAVAVEAEGGIAT
jgi:hypothetical protein